MSIKSYDFSWVKEFVLQNLINADSFIRIFLQNFIDEGLGLRRNVAWVFIVHISDSLHGLLSADVVEGSFTANELICQDPDAPNVNAIIVAFSFNNLGRNVVKSAAVCCSSILANGSPTQIT
jgi:hypothetical protein